MLFKRRKNGKRHPLDVLLLVVLGCHVYQRGDETTRNPVKALYWWGFWGNISCVFCRKKLARTTEKKPEAVYNCCIFCSVKMKEQRTGISQRVHPWVWGGKLKGIWY